MNSPLRVLCCTLLAFFNSAAQQSSKPDNPPAQVPVMNGGAGPCSLDLTITGLDAKPIYAASVKVHVAYGLGGFRKLDLEAGTNSDGKLRFTGLPERVRRPPLEFQASKGNLFGMATVDPSTECEAKRGITLTTRKSQEER